MLSETKQAEVEAIIGPVAGQYETKSEYWIHGDDEGLSYCHDCAEKRVSEIQIAKIPETVRNAVIAELMGAKIYNPISTNSWSVTINLESEASASALAAACETLLDLYDSDIFVDGGWGQEGDTLLMCHTCGTALDNSLTDYGCEYELDHWESVKIKTLNPDLCYSFERILGSQGWTSDLKDRIDRLARRILRVASKNRNSPASPTATEFQQTR